MANQSNNQVENLQVADRVQSSGGGNSALQADAITSAYGANGRDYNHLFNPSSQGMKEFFQNNRDAFISTEANKSTFDASDHNNIEAARQKALQYNHPNAAGRLERLEDRVDASLIAQQNKQA